MKTTFGLKRMVENVQMAKEGKIYLLHMYTEMSLYDGLSVGGKVNVNTQSSSSQKQS